MSRGSLPIEDLDDRTWQDLVDQAKSLVPRYTGEWTDLGPGDLGVTLIELFAWLVEQMLYRLNRVPDRSYLNMLNLLGVTLDPQRPATTLLTFTPLPGASPTVPAHFPVSTLATETSPAVIFETDQALQALPANLRFAFLAGPVAAGQSARAAFASDVTAAIAGSPLGGQPLALKAGQTARIALAFDAPLATPFALEVGITPPVYPPSKPADWPKTSWFLSTAAPGDWTSLAGPASDGTDGLRQSGTVRLPALPPLGWASRKGSDVLAFDPAAPPPPASGQSFFWLAVEVAAQGVDVALGLDSILFNAVTASHVLTVASEPLANADGGTTSTGAPWQRFLFKNRPLHRQPGTRSPYGHVRVYVGPSSTAPGTLWTPVDDFPPGPTTAYRLDPVTGTVLFGDNDGTAKSTGSGLIPPRGDSVFADYRAAAGGVAGNVAPGSLRILQGKLDGIQAVTNPGPGRGGADEESLDDARRRAPDLLRIRNRAVTAEDYQSLALEASTLVARARALATRPDWKTWDGKGGLSRVPGMVNVLIVPNAPPGDPSPSPTQDLIEEVHDYLADRNPVGVALTVLGPRYRPVKVTSAVKLFPGPRQDEAARPQLETALRAAAAAYLHPLTGGPDGRGWEIGQGLLVHGLFARLQSLVGDAGLIQSLTVALSGRPDNEKGLDTSGLDKTVGLALLEYELICSDTQETITVSFFG